MAMTWDVFYWDVARGSAHSRFGSAADRAAAVRDLIGVARTIASLRDEGGAPLNTVVQVRVGDEFAVAPTFDDPTLSDAELSRRIDEAIRAQNELNRSVPVPPPPAATVPTRSATSPSSVTEQWTRVATWLRANLSSVALNGAEPADLARAVEATNIPWPEELSTLFTHINGFPREHWVQLFPTHELFDLDRLVTEHHIELDVWGEFGEELEAPAPAAGDPAGTYLPQFLPFAGRDGNLLFVDTRPGPLHGCVTEFDKVGADDDGPRWTALSAMLADLAHSLETGTTFDRQWLPTVEAGQLLWQFQP
ncbi:SMI1/KNR4 family protein [Nocardia lasii]|uniref:SMI1/KNR4 family protein n=1 Tax=Nocardia lasii TaxID=1616107 RepID=A0ABW1JTF5_9NOCA